jgi:uncharacterized membrane protein YhaH (DUF805 family)
MFDVVKNVFRNYAVFYGRESRRDFWLFQLFAVLVSVAVIFLSVLLITFGAAGSIGLAQTSGYASGANAVIFGGLLVGLWVVFGVAGLAAVVPSLAQQARRLHDANLSAWWLLLYFVPGFGALALFIMALLPSHPGFTPFENEGRGNRQAYNSQQPTYGSQPAPYGNPTPQPYSDPNNNTPGNVW